MSKIRIGVDISHLVHTNYLAGPQRVLIATINSLLSLEKEKNIEIIGIDLSQQPPTTTLASILTHPILRKTSHHISPIDILILIDSNNQYAIDEVHRLRFNGKVVSILHDVLPLKYEKWYKFKNRPNYPIEFYFYMMRMNRFSQVIISPSRENVSDCQTYLPNGISDKIKVIPFGSFWSNETTRNSLCQDSLKRIICVNTLEPKKGHRDILDAFDILIEKDSEWQLYLIGKEGWNTGDLVERILRHPNYQKNLFWLTNLDDLEVFQVYKKCSIAISATHAEGFGLTVEEGLSHGMKMICRDIPVFRERAHENIYFFSGGGDELAKRILFAFSQDLRDFQNVRSMDDFALEMLTYILK